MTLCENEGEDFDELLKIINEIMCKTGPDIAVTQSVRRAGGHELSAENPSPEI